MGFESIVHEINRRALSRPIGRLQELRKQIKGLSRLPSRHMFSSLTTFDDYAFHLGGRTELQFNIGRDRVDRVRKFRHGVAFSLEPGQTLPDVEVLRPKIERFNEFLKQNLQDFSDLWMWHYEGGEPSRKYRPKLISSDLIKPHVFIFLGGLQPLDQIDYEVVLDDFDRLLPLYQFIESSKPKGLLTKTPTQLAKEIELFKEEGRQMEQSLSRRERDPRVRDAALVKYGRACMVCGLDPAVKYGDFAQDCVEVHHLDPLGARSGQGKQTTLDDVIVVCPTCHRALHRYSDPSAWKRFKKECGL
ncbi:MAG: hypothetical protein A3H28_09780 [Acidobacteria bacterium RIFCSPLOWO2_02_FULL_61_28]|nr:MAG: hypothetical protein A3H28_09780 [Acidobacteria bacterium RIFCSPLOWO2_02_FULL_61_28]